MENKDKVIPVSKLLKVMFGVNKKRKLLFIGLTLVIFVILFLVINLGYNKISQTYISTYTYDINGFDNTKYLDGSSFNYNSLIKIDNLNNIKNSNNSYSSIDVDKLYKENGITITYDEELNEYCVSVKRKYFNSYDQAISFISELVSTPIKHSNEIINNISNTKYLNNISDTISFDDYVSYLSNESNYILSKYQELNNSYSSFKFSNELMNKIKYNNNNNNNLSDLYAFISKYVSNLFIDNLNTELQNNGYVRNYDKEISNLQISLDGYNDDLTLINNKINAIKEEINSQSSQTYTNSGLNETLASLLVERENIKDKINKVNNKMENGKTTDSSKFLSKLEETYNTLLELSNDLTLIEQEIYSSNQEIYYSSNSIIVVEGGFSTIITVLVSLVCGLVIASVVNLCLDHKQLYSDDESNN